MNSRRFGRFEIDWDFVRDKPEDVAMVLAKMKFCPLNVECEAWRGKMVYIGTSPMFAEVPEGGEAKEYSVTVHVDPETQNLSVVVADFTSHLGISAKNIKITAIHGGGGWHDASAEYLILPEGMDYEAEAKAWREWYHKEYCPSLKSGKRVEFINTAEWLKQRGAVEPPLDMLEVVDDF